MDNVAGKNAERKGCSRAVRDLPLERFKLPDDGRKWRVLARKRRALLLDISEYANGDGTFLRNFSGRADPENYSPTEERLLKHWAHGSLYRYQKELRLLFLLDWDRPRHHDRRIYLITADEPYPYQEHVPDSGNNHVPDSEKHVHDSPEHVHDSQGTHPVATTPIRLLPSLPSKERPPCIPPKGEHKNNSKRPRICKPDPNTRAERNMRAAGLCPRCAQAFTRCRCVGVVN